VILSLGVAENESNICTKSVDSTAKLWDIHKAECKMNYEGHNHRSYFVGVDSLESIFS